MSYVRKIISMVIIFNCIFSSICHSDCTKPVQPIKQGETAVCDGFLFSPSEEESAYKATQIVDLQKEENEILEKRLTLYMQESDALAKERAQKDNIEGLYRFAYFTLGVIVTGLVVRNVPR